MADLSICFVTTFYPPHSFGGDAISTQRLAERLAMLGHRVRVVHSSSAYTLLGGRDATPATDNGVDVVACSWSSSALMGTYLTGHPIGYRNELGRLVNGFDVVHFVNASLAGGPGAFSLGSGLKVYSTTEHWLLCPTHQLFRYKREVCTKRTCWRCTVVHRRPPQLWRSTALLERSMKHIDLLLCPSRFTQRLHTEAFADVRSEILPLAIPAVRDLPPSTGTRGSEEPYFFSAGRLDRLKSVSSLVRAMRSVHGARLVIAGTGPERPELDELAAGLPVEFLGWVPVDQVISLSAGARAVVVPSIGYETFGLVGAEAMAVGTPIVVRELGPLPELVEEGGGLTFRDDAELITILQRFVDEPEWAATLGDAARASALRRFGIDVVAHRYLDLISRTAADVGRSEIAERARLAATRGGPSAPAP